MKPSGLSHVAKTKTDVLETPVTKEVMDVPFPDGLKPGMIDSFHDGAVRGKASVIPRLLKAIERFPTVPCLKNYLAVAYSGHDKKKEAAIIETMLEAHPDYLFGRVMAATSRIRTGQLEEALNLLGPSLRLRDLYPETQLFHISEVRAYYHAAGLYYLKAGNEAACQGIIEAIQHLVPDAPEVASLLREFATIRIGNMRDRMLEAQRIAIHVKEPEIPTVADFADDDLSFRHDEMFALFDYGYDLPPAKIRSILGLPRETLVADLREILEDAIRTGPAVLRENKASDEEDDFTGPRNALHFLAELKATDVVETVLEFFSQHTELLEMWLGERSFGELLYPYAESSLERLAQWMKQPGLSSIARSGVAEAVASLAMREPSRRAEAISWFVELLEFFAASPREENILDTSVVSGMVWNLCDMRAADTLPLIRRLYDLHLICESDVGSYEDLAEDMEKPIEARKQRRPQPLIDYYRTQITPESAPALPEILRGGIESLLPRPPVQPLVPDMPTGRNDPCPCGSGRKFKKCCMK